MKMKMAKASKADMDQVTNLVGLLNSISSGYFPSTSESEEDDPSLFDEDDPAHLRIFYDRVKACLDAAPGGIFRVVYGYITIMGNDVVDPDVDHLDLHPRIRDALARPPADVGALAYPSELTPALRRVLGMLCYQFITYAQLFRASGVELAHRAEDEQAYCLHWLIKHVLRHGDDWAKFADAEVAAMRARLAPPAEKTPNPDVSVPT